MVTHALNSSLSVNTSHPFLLGEAATRYFVEVFVRVLDILQM